LIGSASGGTTGADGVLVESSICCEVDITSALPAVFPAIVEVQALAELPGILYSVLVKLPKILLPMSDPAMMLVPAGCWVLAE